MRRSSGSCVHLASPFTGMRLVVTKSGTTLRQIVTQQFPIILEICRYFLGKLANGTCSLKTAFRLAKCNSTGIMFSAAYRHGGMAEWSMAAVLKGFSGIFNKHKKFN
jgi:hypothetical protein